MPKQPKPVSALPCGCTRQGGRCETEDRGLTEVRNPGAGCYVVRCPLHALRDVLMEIKETAA